MYNIKKKIIFYIIRFREKVRKNINLEINFFLLKIIIHNIMDNEVLSKMRI